MPWFFVYGNPRESVKKKKSNTISVVYGINYARKKKSNKNNQGDWERTLLKVVYIRKCASWHRQTNKRISQRAKVPLIWILKRTFEVKRPRGLCVAQARAQLDNRKLSIVNFIIMIKSSICQTMGKLSFNDWIMTKIYGLRRLYVHICR